MASLIRSGLINLATAWLIFLVLFTINVSVLGQPSSNMRLLSPGNTWDSTLAELVGVCLGFTVLGFLVRLPFGWFS